MRRLFFNIEILFNSSYLLSLFWSFFQYPFYLFFHQRVTKGDKDKEIKYFNKIGLKVENCGQCPGVFFSSTQPKNKDNSKHRLANKFINPFSLGKGNGYKKPTRTHF